MSALRYLIYILCHKWWVAVAMHRVGGSIRLAVLHDWSKFLPGEFFAYRRRFYGDGGGDFASAWKSHYRRNKHHWEFWGGRQIPEQYALEMLADWMGAGRAIAGKWEYAEWYKNNRDKMNIHPATRAFVENRLREMADALDGGKEGDSGGQKQD